MRFTQWSTWRAIVPTMVLMFSGTVVVAQQHEHEGNQTAPAGTQHREEAADHADELAESGEQHHDHGIQQIGETEIFLVEGLRVDPEFPPGGSAVGRAGASLPGGGYLHVVYGKPYKRAREIFGEVVKYDKVWVTGAHLSTELVVTVPVMIAGQHLDPGVYSLFTTPRHDRWTLHINEALGLHLASEYDPGTRRGGRGWRASRPGGAYPGLRHRVPAGRGRRGSANSLGPDRRNLSDSGPLTRRQIPGGHHPWRGKGNTFVKCLLDRFRAPNSSAADKDEKAKLLQTQSLK